MKTMKRVRANTFYDEDKLGDYVVACNVCGQIAIADNEEELSNVACSECGNIDWSVLPYRKGSPVADVDIPPDSAVGNVKKTVARCTQT